MQTKAHRSRSELLKLFFPHNIPKLWCPLLTHYDDQGNIDKQRIIAHLKHLSPYVKGFLIAGSTGDGWEINQQEALTIFDIAIEQARLLNLNLLLGVLNTDAAKTKENILATNQWLTAKVAENDIQDALLKTHVCGYTICPPSGAELLQQTIAAALSDILTLNLPTTLYQPPQITQNQMAPSLVVDLAKRFNNFLMFKDNSGKDHVALSAENLNGVVLVRGAEGDYNNWYKPNGKPYYGLLLSSANAFAAAFQQIIEHVNHQQIEQAQSLSARVTHVVNDALNTVAKLTIGNPFTNANKALDHFFAYGSNAIKAPPPRLHGGGYLAVDVLRAVEKLLVDAAFIPTKGYLSA